MSENAQSNQNFGPLKGVRVIDLTRILAGPSATQTLGDMGAEVIKVERPGMGDDTRGWGPPFVKDKDGSDTSESAYYLSVNRNKRSISVDMRDEDDLAALKELIKTADVLVENFKLDGLKPYGLDYASVEKINPALVYCSITGFGQTGPNAHKAGYDLMIQGWGGIMSLTGPADGEPSKVAVAIADLMTGMYASTAILAALRHATATGEGQHIDLALADTQVAWLANLGSNYLVSGQTPTRHGNQHANIVPYQVFAVNDGHVIVAVGNDAQYERFCTILGRPDLFSGDYVKNQGRLAHRDVLIPEIQKAMMAFSKAEMIASMEAEKIPGGPINTIPEVMDSDQVAARDMIVDMDHPLAAEGTVPLVGSPIKFSKTPVTYRHAPPTNGEANSEILDPKRPNRQ